MTYEAQYFGDLFVAVTKTEQARRSFKSGVSVGTGHIPYDTGALQSSIYVSRVSEKGCTIEIGNDAAPYAVALQCAENVGKSGAPNRHRGFVEKFARTEFVSALKKEFEEVKIV